MNITDVTTLLFEYPTHRRRGDAHAPAGRTRQHGVLVEISTDEGPTGVSIGNALGEASIHRLKPAIVGRDPRQVRGIWQTLVDLAFKGGNVGLVNDAISAIDVALWDLKAKAYGEPLWRLLGAAEPRARGYASGGDMPLSDEQLGAFYAHMATLGFRAGKLKVGLSIDDDLRRIGIMQSALGGPSARPALMIDASEYWSAKQAVRRIEEMERHFDFTFVEEPVQRLDYRGLQTVSRHIRSPVAAGENLDNVMQFLPYVDHQAVDVLQVNWTMAGITGALQIADLAYAHGLPVAVGDSTGKFMAHVAAALPNHMILEVHDDVTEEPGVSSDCRIDDGWIMMGDEPGIGLSIDRDLLARHAVSALTPGSGPNPKGRRAGAGTIEVPATPEEKSVGASGVEATS